MPLTLGVIGKAASTVIIGPRDQRERLRITGGKKEGKWREKEDRKEGTTIHMVINVWKLEL